MNLEHEQLGYVRDAVLADIRRRRTRLKKTTARGYRSTRMLRDGSIESVKRDEWADWLARARHRLRFAEDTLAVIESALYERTPE